MSTDTLTLSITDCGSGTSRIVRCELKLVDGRLRGVSAFNDEVQHGDLSYAALKKAVEELEDHNDVVPFLVRTIRQALRPGGAKTCICTGKYRDDEDLWLRVKEAEGILREEEQWRDLHFHLMPHDEELAHDLTAASWAAMLAPSIGAKFVGAAFAGAGSAQLGIQAAAPFMSTYSGLLVDGGSKKERNVEELKFITEKVAFITKMRGGLGAGLFVLASGFANTLQKRTDQTQFSVADAISMYTEIKGLLGDFAGLEEKERLDWNTCDLASAILEGIRVASPEAAILVSKYVNGIKLGWVTSVAFEHCAPGLVPQVEVMCTDV